jgi:hypothetical protein
VSNDYLYGFDIIDITAFRAALSTPLFVVSKKPDFSFLSGKSRASPSLNLARNADITS